MRTPRSSRPLGPPLAAMDPESIKQFGALLNTPQVAGSRASWTENDVRAGKQHPFLILAKMWDRHAENGGEVDDVLRQLDEMRRMALVRYGRMLGVTDLDAYIDAETEAEGEANRFDVKGRNLRAMDWPQRFEYAHAAWRDAEASTDRAYAVDACNHHDLETLRQARARLLATRPA